MSVTDQPGQRGGDGGWTARVPASRGRAAVSWASSALMAVGTFLPWQVVRYEHNREVSRGWKLAAGEAAVCMALAIVGVLAGWSFTRGRGIVAAVVGRLALLAAGGTAAGVAALQAVRVGERLALPGLSTSPGWGLVVVGVGALGLVGAGAWSAWRPVGGARVARS